MRATLILLLLAALLASGTPALRAQSALDSFNPNANGAVQVIVVQPDNKILIGGDFTTLAPNGGGTVVRTRIARLNPDGTVDLGFNPNASSSVYAIALQPDGNILVGGAFTSIGGQARRNIARLNADGTLDSDFNPNPSGTNSAVFSLAVQTDGKILVGGRFTSIGGQTRNRIARLDATTGLADLFDANSDGQVNRIALAANGKIVVVGEFANIGGQPRQRVARLDASTGLADAFNPDADSTPLSVKVQPDGRVLVAGYFNSIGGQVRKLVARLDNMAGQADTFNPGVTGQYMQEIALQADGKVLVGGSFSRIGLQTRNYIARLEAASGLADSFNPNANAPVWALAVQVDGKILVGGLFTTIASDGGPIVIRNRIARLENPPPTPTPTPSPGTCGWSEAPRAPGPIRSHAVTSLGGYLYSFGGYDNVSTTATSYKFDGSAWTLIAPLPAALSGAAAVNDGTNIYVVGGSNSSGIQVNTLYRYDPVANSYATMAPCATFTSSHAAVYLNGKIYKIAGAMGGFGFGTNAA